MDALRRGRFIPGRNGSSTNRCCAPSSRLAGVAQAAPVGNMTAKRSHPNIKCGIREIALINAAGSCLPDWRTGSYVTA